MKKITKTSLVGYMKRFYAFLFFLIICLPSFSQNVGINATGTAPNANAGLDVDFTNKGVLIPRVALTNTASFAPLSAHVPGMIVYNTATIGDVRPGFYYDNGFSWIAGFPTGTATGNMIYWNGTAWLMIPAGLPGQILQLNASSIPYWGGATGPLATLTTNVATLITGTTATTGANITADAGFPILSRGVCYGTTSGPTTANSILVASPATGTGTFTSNLTGLLPVTTYYVKAYATNSMITTYGNEITFTTLPVIPTLATTTAATTITGTTAVSGGNVTATGGAAITERGICYGTTTTPTVANTKVIDSGTGTGTFISNLSGLTGNTLYYVRSYAINSAGTAYGAQISFTTLVVPPTLATVTASSITGASAVSGGSMTWGGGGYSNYQNYGVCYSTTPVTTLPAYIETSSPNYARVATNTTNGSVNISTPIGPWVTTLTGLTSNTTYYIRSYLNLYKTSPSGWVTVYGPEISFTTTAPTAPVLSATTAITGLTSNIATTGGTITSDGGAAITVKGVCWGTTANPVLGSGNFTSNGTGTATFTSNITGLTGNTLYHVRSYATNSVGTSYGPDITFTTWVQAAYTLGQNLTYGYCAYVAPDGSGFIVSPDIAFTGAWGCSGTVIGTATGTGIGAGLTNTNSILANCATRPIAASICRDYNGGGFTDWYLPSSGEWQQILNVGSTIGLYGHGLNMFYTSTEYSTPGTYAAAAFFNSNSGYMSGTLKTGGTANYINAIRAIRYFTAPLVPTVTATTAATTITPTGAVSGGDISTDGGMAVTARGVCWSTTASPTVALATKTVDGTGTGTFVSTITGLTPSTLYHVRAYATNGVGTAYGADITFTTGPLSAPAVSTDAISNLASTTATSGGNITSDGGAAVSARGVCWSTSTGPTTASTILADSPGTGTGTFVSNLSGLTAGTTYYLKAYATNSVGTTYGNEVVFTTPSLPTLTTTAITNLAGTSATSGGNITNNGGTAVTARGVCWSTTAGAVLGVGNFTSDGTGNGIFVSNITGLTTGVLYYVRAYATNASGTAYGNEISFTPSGPSIPTLTTALLTNPTSTGGTFGGNITSDGGSAVTARGVCWNQVGGATITGLKTTDGTGTGVFASNVTGLIAGNGYFIRAYATNSIGTAYGQEEYYVPVGLPVLTTLSLSYTAPATTALSGVNVTNASGGTLSAIGIVWGTTSGPTILSHLGITSENLANGWYAQSTITGIQQNVTYYVRAYATNEIGTSYGPEISFTPGVLAAPSVQTDAIINKIGALAEGGGTILTDNGDPITASGICWGTSANPSLLSNLGFTNEAAVSGQYFSNLSGLNVGTTYHVRAYATNATGTGYGTDVSFVATAATMGQYLSGGLIYGYVFSIDGTGTHGLIADPWGYGVSDWGCTSSVTGATGTAIGTGMTNTTAIINDIATNACSSASQMAAYAAQVSKFNGVDWYLPSKDEFNLLWTNQNTDITGGLSGNLNSALLTAPFWSSSEVNATNAWNFNGTTWLNTGLKTAQYTVWPIRSF